MYMKIPPWENWLVWSTLEEVCTFVMKTYVIISRRADELNDLLTLHGS